MAKSKIKEVILHSGDYLSETNLNFCLPGNFRPNKVWGNGLTISDENGNCFDGEIGEKTQLGQLLTDDYGSYLVKSSDATKEAEIFYLAPDLKKYLLLQKLFIIEIKKRCGSKNH